MKRPSKLATLFIAVAVSLPVAAFQRPGGPPPSRQGQGPGGQHMRGPGPHAGDWLRQNMNLSPDEQRKRLESDKDFRNLPQDQQQRLRSRLDRFLNLSPDQKKRFLNRMEWFEHLSPEQKAKANDTHMQMQALDPERRKAVRHAMSGMRGMSQDDQRKEIDSDRVKSSFNDQERSIMKSMVDIGAPQADDDNPPPHLD